MQIVMSLKQSCCQSGAVSAAPHAYAAATQYVMFPRQCAIDVIGFV